MSFSFSTRFSTPLSLLFLAFLPALGQAQASPSDAISSSAKDLLPYSAEYEARSSGLKAQAFRELTRSEAGHYELENRIAVRVLGAALASITEQSRFQWQHGDLQPLSYRYEQSGIRRSSRTLEFDWEAGTALSSESPEGEITVESGVMDTLSYYTRLRYDLQNSDATEFSYSVVDKGELEVHNYRLAGEEIITTGAGDLRTVRIERVREPESSRRTTLWLAKDWHYMLVKLEQTGDSSSGTELLLEEATIGDVEVQAMTPLAAAE